MSEREVFWREVVIVVGCILAVVALASAGSR